MAAIGKVYGQRVGVVIWGTRGNLIEDLLRTHLEYLFILRMLVSFREIINWRELEKGKKKSLVRIC